MLELKLNHVSKMGLWIVLRNSPMPTTYLLFRDFIGFDHFLISLIKDDWVFLRKDVNTISVMIIDIESTVLGEINLRWTM